MEKLDIRYEKADNSVDEKQLSAEQKEDIARNLNSVYGHLASDMKKTGGYILMYTIGDQIHNSPNAVNCSESVLKQFNEISGEE